MLLDAACIFFWQSGGGGAIVNFEGTLVITESEFEGNTAEYVSDGLCCVLFFKRFLSN